MSLTPYLYALRLKTSDLLTLLTILMSFDWIHGCKYNIAAMQYCLSASIEAISSSPPHAQEKCSW